METDEVELRTVSPRPVPSLETVAERARPRPVPDHRTAPSTAVESDRPSASSHRPAHRGPRPPWWPVVSVVGSLVLVAAVVVALVDQSRLQRADSAIAGMRAELHRMTTRIAAARARLSEAARESGAAAGTLAATSAQLGTVQAQLASAQANIRVDGSSIANLDVCLSGVNRALNEIALGAGNAAGAILRQSAGTCQAAEPSG